MTFRILRSLGLAVLAGLTFAAAQAAGPGRTPKPSITIEKPGQCVEPTDLMRRDHMKLLKHQRDKTMYEGIRTKPHSLNECIACHASQKAGSVTSDSRSAANSSSPLSAVTPSAPTTIG